MIVMRINVVLT